MEQERYNEQSSVGDAFTSGFPLSTFLLGIAETVQSCAICSNDSVAILKSLGDTLRVSYRFF